MRIAAAMVFFALLPFGVFAQSSTANVVSFGAIPDDGIDDSAAIQAALNYVVSRSGGKVFIPAGKWNVAQNLWIGDNTDVEGEGYASVISSTAYLALSNSQGDDTRGNHDINIRNL